MNRATSKMIDSGGGGRVGPFSTDLDEGGYEDQEARGGRRVPGAPAPVQDTPERERTFPT